MNIPFSKQQPSETLSTKELIYKKVRGEIDGEVSSKYGLKIPKPIVKPGSSPEAPKRTAAEELELRALKKEQEREMEGEQKTAEGEPLPYGKRINKEDHWPKDTGREKPLPGVMDIYPEISINGIKYPMDTDFPGDAVGGDPDEVYTLIGKNAAGLLMFRRGEERGKPKSGETVYISEESLPAIDPKHMEQEKNKFEHKTKEAVQHSVEVAESQKETVTVGGAEYVAGDLANPLLTATINEFLKDNKEKQSPTWKIVKIEPGKKDVSDSVIVVKGQNGKTDFSVKTLNKAVERTRLENNIEKLNAPAEERRKVMRRSYNREESLLYKETQEAEKNLDAMSGKALQDRLKELYWLLNSQARDHRKETRQKKVQSALAELQKFIKGKPDAFIFNKRDLIYPGKTIGEGWTVASVEGSEFKLKGEKSGTILSLDESYLVPGGLNKDMVAKLLKDLKEKKTEKSEDKQETPVEKKKVEAVENTTPSKLEAIINNLTMLSAIEDEEAFQKAFLQVAPSILEDIEAEEKEIERLSKEQ